MLHRAGAVVKKPLSRADIDIVVDLFKRIRPHQIYAAGDLSDPHGTHRTCLQVKPLDSKILSPWTKTTISDPMLLKTIGFFVTRIAFVDVHISVNPLQADDPWGSDSVQLQTILSASRALSLHPCRLPHLRWYSQIWVRF